MSRRLENKKFDKLCPWQLSPGRPQGIPCREGLINSGMYLSLSQFILPTELTSYATDVTLLSVTSFLPLKFSPSSENSTEICSMACICQF